MDERIRAVYTRVVEHFPPGQFGRYLAVGVWNTLFGYATFAALVWLLSQRMSHGYIVAQVVSSLINITVAYFGYKLFVFKTRGNYMKEWLRCLSVYGLSSTLPGLILLPALVGLFHVAFHLHRSAPYIAGALLQGAGVVYGFFGNRNFTFRAAEPV